MANKLFVSGTCRYCGCTDERACVFRDPATGNIWACSWVDEAHTICSACVTSAVNDGLFTSRGKQAA